MGSEYEMKVNGMFIVSRVYEGGDKVTKTGRRVVGSGGYRCVEKGRYDDDDAQRREYER